MKDCLPQVCCPQCGALVPDVAGPVHRYVPASPGCWDVFGNLQADGLRRFGHSPTHGLVVDAYMAQHPGGGNDRRDRQSVFAHLAGLCARLELELPVAHVMDVLRRIVAGRNDFPILPRDGGPGELTVLHVVSARGHTEYEDSAQEWGRAVWQTWAKHHATIVAAVCEVTDTSPDARALPAARTSAQPFSRSDGPGAAPARTRGRRAAWRRSAA